MKKQTTNKKQMQTTIKKTKKAGGRSETPSLRVKKITAGAVLGEILEIPGAESILAKYKVPCLSCPMAQFEMQSLTIGDICKMYGIDLKKLLVDLNK